MLERWAVVHRAKRPPGRDEPAPDRPTTQLSAHRGGVGTDAAAENTRRALEAACRLPCEFVEFDVQRLGDGTLVLFHDAELRIAGRRLPLDGIDYRTFARHVPEHVRYVDALAILAGRRKAHIDLKFMSPPTLLAQPDATWEVAATRAAVDVLGAENLIVTTVEDPSVRALRTWAARNCPRLLVGLSLGRSTSSLGPVQGLLVRLSELFPHRRIRACDANLVVANWVLARLTLARYARRHDVPLLVWTVDGANELRRWIEGQDRAWLVTSNHPLLAAAVRERSMRSGFASRHAARV